MSTYVENREFTEPCDFTLNMAEFISIFIILLSDSQKPGFHYPQCPELFHQVLTLILLARHQNHHLLPKVCSSFLISTNCTAIYSVTRARDLSFPRLLAFPLSPYLISHQRMSILFPKYLPKLSSSPTPTIIVLILLSKLPKQLPQWFPCCYSHLPLIYLLRFSQSDLHVFLIVIILYFETITKSQQSWGYSTKVLFSYNYL